MNQLLERLKNDFRDEEARYAYADSVVNAFVSAQIKNLREARDLKQGDLAEMVGTKQSGISRLEKADYSVWKIETLRKLARAFGVRLSIRFEEFGTLLDDVAGFKKAKLLPRQFAEDPVFQARGRASHRKVKVYSPHKRRRGGTRRKLSLEEAVPRKAPERETDFIRSARPLMQVVGRNSVSFESLVNFSNGNNSSSTLVPIAMGANAAANYQEAQR